MERVGMPMTGPDRPDPEYHNYRMLRLCVAIGARRSADKNALGQ
jgi:hypothetical protein